MILAAFWAARKNDQSKMPRELVTGLQCKGWGTLPRAGGYYDQPAKLMHWMTQLLNVWHSTRAWKSSNDWAKFVRERPEDWEIVSWLIQLEKKHGGNLVQS